VLGLVWFTLIRPRAAERLAEDGPEVAGAIESGAEPGTDLDQPRPLASNLASNARESGNPELPADNPVVINNSPARPLPGSGDRPDANRDVDRAMGNGSTTSTNTPGNSGPGGTDILGAASQQGEQRPADRTQNRPTAQPAGTRDPSGIRLQLDTARRLVAENDRVGARQLLSQTLINADLSESERQRLRDELTVLNQQLVFSPVAEPNDPMTETYRVQSGDSLSKIAARRELAVHWKFIARVNGISDPSRIRLGQELKLVRGPFHAIVDKSDHRIDIYHGSPADPSGWLYIRSFDVGLGTNGGTPVGEFVVSTNKLENPGWVNPRDAREQYAPNDPENPIGEYWVGLTGVGDYADLTSYGIHGTIDPDSIGGDESMGCVRLAAGDIDVVYELLAEHISRVLIVP